MEIATISLLIANLVTIAAASTVVAKEINKLNKRVQTLEEVTECKLEDCVEILESDTATEELKEELKEHISKEFRVLSFRGFRFIK